MLKCPTCAFENDDFATVCANCKSFLQNRVPNLDLFATAWGMLESPRKTFRTIRLAEHKNYTLFLFACFGIAASFTIFWYLELGRLFDSLLFLIPWAMVSGIVLGLLAGPVMALMVHVFARMFGSKSGFRDTFAVVGYSLVPLVFSLVLVLPIELLTFGMYLFTSNPHPFVIKPVSYLMLAGFDGLMTLWTVILAMIGVSVVHRFSLVVASAIIFCVLSLVLGVFFLTADYIHQLSVQIL